MVNYRMTNVIYKSSCMSTIALNDFFCLYFANSEIFMISQSLKSTISSFDILILLIMNYEAQNSN